MDAKLLLTNIRDQVQKLRATGTEAISLADLEIYLANVQKSLENLPAELQKVEPLKVQHDFSLAEYNWKRDSSLEMFRSVITTGQSALKACMILNGGAALAILTFIGHAASASTSKVPISMLATPLAMFVFGALCSAIAAGVTYLAQFTYNSHRKTLGNVINVIVILVVVVSYILFTWASFASYRVFLKM